MARPKSRVWFLGPYSNVGMWTLEVHFQTKEEAEAAVKWLKGHGAVIALCDAASLTLRTINDTLQHERLTQWAFEALEGAAVELRTALRAVEQAVDRHRLGAPGKEVAYDGIEETPPKSPTTT